MRRDTGTGLLIGVAGLLAACRGVPVPPTDADSGTNPGYVSVLPLANAEYSIVEMATAHGAFTIEVEIAPGADTARIARGLVGPIRDQYAEVLVYFYDRGGDGALPISRVQWTPENGFSELVY